VRAYAVYAKGQIVTGEQRKAALEAAGIH